MITSKTFNRITDVDFIFSIYSSFGIDSKINKEVFVKTVNKVKNGLNPEIKDILEENNDLIEFEDEKVDFIDVYEGIFENRIRFFTNTIQSF